MKVVNVDDVLKILHKYGKYIFVTDEKRYASMVDEIANLKALEQKEKTGWTPVSERLPEECSGVLVYCPENKNIFLAYLEIGKWYIFSPNVDEPIDEPSRMDAFTRAIQGRKRG